MPSLHRLLLTGMVLLVLTSCLLAQDPVEPEDLWTLPRATDPIVAPDGQSALYQLRQADRERGNRQSVLMRIDLETLGRSPLTFNVADVAWSPDGRYLSFRGRYGGTYGLYRAELVVEADGARLNPPLLLTELPPTPAHRGTPATWRQTWSPDGTRLAYVAREGSGCGTTEKPTEPIVLDDPLPTHVQGLEPECLPRLFVMPTRGGEAPRALSRPGRAVGAPSWGNDGRLAYVQAGAGGTDTIWIVDAGSGERRMIAAAKGRVRDLDWSPSSDAILFLAELPPVGDEGPAVELRTVSPDGNGSRPLATGLAAGATRARWSPDGEWAYFMAPEGGRDCVYRVPASGDGESQAVVCREGHAGAYALYADQILYSYDAPGEMPNLYRADADGLFREAITFHGRAWARARELADIQTFPFTAPDGTEAQGLLARPAGASDAEALPLVHYVSGGPGAQPGLSFDFLRQVLAGAGYAVLQVPMAWSLPWDGAAAGSRLSESVDGAVARQAAGLQAALDQFDGLDPERLALIGESDGAYLALRMLARPGGYRAASVRGAPTNLVTGRGHGATAARWQASPLAEAEAVQTPTLLLHGEADAEAPIGSAAAYFATLRRSGVPARLVRYPGAGHTFWPPAAEVHAYQQILQWLKQHIPNE